MSDILEIPNFDGIEAVFGANLSHYPDMDSIPDEFRHGRAKGCDVFSKLFFSGGKVEDHGLQLKPGVDRSKFYRALRALMSSFEPKHELKEATCGWLIESHTEAISDKTQPHA